MSDIFNLLNSTVALIKVNVDGNNIEYGNGFFVFKNHLLTCAHVIEGYESINVCFNGIEYDDIEVIVKSNMSYPDIALLRIKTDVNHKCVYFGEESIKPGDDIYSYSNFSSNNDWTNYTQDPSYYICEGTGKKLNKNRLIKLKASRAIPGMSGAPLLSIRTGRVIGILKASRNIDTPEGARGIPSNSIFELISNLRGEQKKYHQENTYWFEAIGQEVKDLSLKVKIKSHFQNRGYIVSIDKSINNVVFDLQAYKEHDYFEENLLIKSIKFQSNFKEKTISEFDMQIVMVNHRSKVKSYTGIIVTDFNPTDKIINLIKDSEIKLLNISKIFRPDIDYVKISEKNINDYNNNELKNFYVDLGCKTNPGDKSGTEYRPVENYLIDQFETSKKLRGVVILGNFGTGKSSFCKQYAYKLSTNWMNKGKSYFPIYFNLRDFRSFDNIINEMEVALINDYDLDVKEFGLERFLMSNETILILDGFDEMANKMNPKEILNSIKNLEAFTTNYKLARFILTCRTHFFKNNFDENRVLKKYKRLYILDWGEKEIKEYFKKANSLNYDEVITKINQTYNLDELSKTPMFAYMIKNTISEMNAVFDKSKLYENYIKNWIEREDQRIIELGGEQRQAFMENLSYQMYLTKKFFMTESELNKFISDFYNITKYEITQIIEQDIRLSTFLVRREGSGIYEFQHRSFMEFFIGKTLAKDIKNNILYKFEEILISEEIANFMSDYFRDDVLLLINLIEKSNEKTFKIKNILAILGSFKYDKQIVEALVSYINTNKNTSLLSDLLDILNSYNREKSAEILLSITNVSIMTTVSCLLRLVEYLDIEKVVNSFLYHADNTSDEETCSHTWRLLNINSERVRDYFEYIDIALIDIVSNTDLYKSKVIKPCIEASFIFLSIDAIRNIYINRKKLTKKNLELFKNSINNNNSELLNSADVEINEYFKNGISLNVAKSKLQKKYSFLKKENKLNTFLKRTYNE